MARAPSPYHATRLLAHNLCACLCDPFAPASLSGNFLRDDAAMAIARNLHHNDTLLRLKLTSTFWIPVQDVRSRVCEVPELRFPKAGLERLDFLVVGELLRKNQCMEILDLRGNDMHQVHGIQCLAPALAINESLTELHFVWNTFGPEGMEVLADAIVGRNHLRHLTLRAVGVGPGKGALALGRIVASSTSLTRLECVLNSLSHGGTRALTDALLVNIFRTLTSRQPRGTELDVMRALYLQQFVYFQNFTKFL